MVMLGSPPRAPRPRSPTTPSSSPGPKSRRFVVTTHNPPRITKSRLNLEGWSLRNVNAHEPARGSAGGYFRRSHFKKVGNGPMSAFGRTSESTHLMSAFDAVAIMSHSCWRMSRLRSKRPFAGWKQTWYCARRHKRRGRVGGDDRTIPGQISARQCPVLLPQSSLSGRL